jgi:WD40 repeat protein
MTDSRPASELKYWAFVSYSSKDRTWGKWLIDALEKYRVPKSLIGLKTSYGVVPPRLYPVFRDRDELRVGSDVGQALHDALMQSRYLVVICSPNSADPRSWVSKEITSFKTRGREEEVLALIVDGEAPDCFPSPLRHRFDEQGHETDLPADPLAADIRREDDRPRAARRKALLKLIARMIGVDFDTLEQRDRRRRRQRRIAWSVAALALLAVLGVLTSVWLSATRTALSQQLAKQARDESDSRPDLALLLSVLSYRVVPTAAAFDSILETIWPRQNLVAYLQHPGRILAVAFAPDDRSLAVASCGQAPPCATTTITRYDLDSLRVLGAPATVSGEVGVLMYQAHSGKLLILGDGSAEHQLLTLDPEQGTSPAPLYQSSDPISSVAVSEDGQFYAVGMKSGEFKVFATGVGHRCDGTVRGPVRALTFSADDRKFAALSEQDTTIIDLTDSSCPTQTQPNGERVASVAFDPIASELYVVFLDGTIDRWRLDAGTRERFSFTPAEGFVHALDGQARYLASQHTDYVRIYDLAVRRDIKQQIEETGDETSPVLQYALQQVEAEAKRLPDVAAKRIVFSASSKLVATIDADGHAIVWSTADRPVVEQSSADQEPEEKPSPKATEAVSPDQRLRAEARARTEGCGTEAKQLCQQWTELRLVDGESGLQIALLPGPREHFRMSGPTSVAFQKDGSVEIRGELWREVWHVAPQSLVARACHMANRDLTDAEIDDHVGWRKRIVRTAHPCPEGARLTHDRP